MFFVSREKEDANMSTSTTNYAASLENLYRASGLNVRVGASTVDGAL